MRSSHRVPCSFTFPAVAIMIHPLDCPHHADHWEEEPVNESN